MRRLYIRLLYLLYEACGWLRHKVLAAMLKAAQL
jgi:hypothetical protein